jgi:Ribbon-helix-helix protein, copG family
VSKLLVNYRLPTGLFAALAEEAARSGLTRTEVVRQAIEARLATKPQPPTARPEHSDAELADEFEAAVRRRGAQTEQLARRKAAELGISDA